MKALAKIKYLFDQGGTFMPIISFVLLVVATADKLGSFLGIGSRAFILVGAPLGLIGLVCVGWVMDRFGYTRHYQEEQNRRNEMLKSALTKGTQ